MLSFKLPRWVRYLLHRERLERLVVSMDIQAKTRSIYKFMEYGLQALTPNEEVRVHSQYARFYILEKEFQENKNMPGFVSDIEDLCKRLNFYLLKGSFNAKDTGVYLFFSVQRHGIEHVVAERDCYVEEYSAAVHKYYRAMKQVRELNKALAGSR